MNATLSSIGSKPAPSFDAPLDMLYACHERIEAQLCTLEKLCAHLGANGSDEQARQAAQAVMRYFDTAAPNHHRDEDEDLFPLLRALAAKAGREEIGATLYELEREHQSMDLLYSGLRLSLDAVAKGRPARLDAEDVARFAWLYRRHLRLEEAAVLPFARDALDANQQRRLGERMTQRRRIAPSPIGADEQ